MVSERVMQNLMWKTYKFGPVSILSHPCDIDGMPEFHQLRHRRELGRRLVFQHYTQWQHIRMVELPPLVELLCKLW